MKRATTTALLLILASSAASSPLSSSSSSAGSVLETDGKEQREKRGDDVSLDSLAALVQQQATAIQTLQAKVTALENKTPSSFQPVAFTVRFSKDDPTGKHGVALSPHSTLIFDSIVTNIGNAYNSATGLFTAPVSGVYVFFLTVMSSNAHGNNALQIVKQRSTILDEVFTEGSTDIDDQGSSLTTTHLSVGDQVWVRQALGDSVRGSFWTVFSGHLVQAD